MLFADKKLTACITAASCVTVLASCMVAAGELRKGDPMLIPDMGLAVIVMLASYIGARMMIKYVRQQIDFILANAKQKNELLEKLQIDNLMGIYNRIKMENVIETLITSGEESSLH